VSKLPQIVTLVMPRVVFSPEGAVKQRGRTGEVCGAWRRLDDRFLAGRGRNDVADSGCQEVSKVLNTKGH